MENSHLFLITRPFEEAAKTARKFNYVGFNSFSQPVFKINFLHDVPRLELQSSDVVLITSRNGAQGFVNICADRTAQILTVGKNAAKFLNDNGFNNIIHIAPTMALLIDHINNNPDLKKGNIIYIRGRVATSGLKEKLPGAKVSEHIVYETVAEKDFKAETVNLLNQKKISGIVFYSSETLRIFTRLSEKAKISGLLETQLLCLSPQIAAVATELGYKNIRIANAPNERAMIELVQEICK